jgi:hypothetical protein
MKWWHTKHYVSDFLLKCIMAAIYGLDILNTVIDQYKYEWLEWKCCQFSLLPSSI